MEDVLETLLSIITIIALCVGMTRKKAKKQTARQTPPPMRSANPAWDVVPAADVHPLDVPYPMESGEMRPEMEMSAEMSTEMSAEMGTEGGPSRPLEPAEQTPEQPLEVIRRVDPACDACGTAYVDAEHMREAVIMSEILNKPVSLRRRRVG